MALQRISAIDTFSGTGGISLALQEFTSTVLYCEINPYCQKVLAERMQEGRLDPGPIHGDIKTLHVSPMWGPEMIMGGSPCTDVSSIGLKQGIVDGPQSSLFYEIVRIVDECPTIQIVFLENVANILKCGLQDVVTELRKRDFNIYWTTRSASSLGAPHQRNRWFCLATRAGYQIDIERFTPASLQRGAPNERWAEEPPRRFTYRPGVREDASYDPNWSLRSQCMGNAVVPEVVRTAFVDLVKMHHNWRQLRETLLDFGGPVTELTYPYPEACLIIGDTYFALPFRPAFGGTNSGALAPIEVQVGERKVALASYPTPRRGIVHASTPTERSMHDLPTVLVHSEVSKSIMRAELGLAELPEKITALVHPNIQYIEWLMGYDKDWTRILQTVVKQASSSSGGGAPEDVSIEQDAGPSTPPPTASSLVPAKRINALNLYHKEVFPHKSINDICKVWRELSAAEKKKYSDRAREIRLAA